MSARPPAAGFRRVRQGGRTVTVRVDGRPVVADARDTVAAMLMASGMLSWRDNPVSGEARGPYCMMGVCFECVLAIDGVSERRACMVTVREGMRIDTAGSGTGGHGSP